MPFEIYLAQYPWRGCNDARPWLLIQPCANGGFSCFGISGQDYEYDAFPLEMTDPQFPATGLRKTSYIHDNGPMSDLPPTAFMKKWGELTGDLLIRFRKSAGV